VNDPTELGATWAETCTRCNGAGSSLHHPCAWCSDRGYHTRYFPPKEAATLPTRGNLSPGELRYLADLDAGRAP